jgi:hypothetical protein
MNWIVVGWVIFAAVAVGLSVIYGPWAAQAFESYSLSRVHWNRVQWIHGSG